MNAPLARPTAAGRPGALLTLAGVGRRLGLPRDTVKKYRLPEPDFIADGRQALWTPATIDAWDASRPGRRRVERPA